MTNGTLTLPSADEVRKACARFNTDMDEPDLALFKLFTQYPENTHLSHVLLKVVTLNSLYSTRIRVNSKYRLLIVNILPLFMMSFNKSSSTRSMPC
jgi:hypothetical protein